MADLEKTVAIIFEGVDQMGAGVTSATKRIDGFADSVEAVAEPMANVTKTLLALEGAAAGMAVAFGKVAYDASVELESAQADLAKTLGDGEGAVEDYTRQITDLSNTYGISADQLVQSMASYKQAGFTAEESLGLVKDSLDLVIAGDVEAAEASEILVASLKGFKAPASDAGQLLEVLNASSNTYATNVSELAAGMARLSPIASTLGMDFEQTAELLIPVIEVFRSGPEAANALRTGLLRLGDDSAPVVDTLERLGVSQRDANGVLRSSGDIINDVAEATGGLADAEKLFVAQQLFGIEQAPKMVEVLGSLEGATIDVGKALETSASVADEVAIRLGTAEKAADRTAVAFENMAATLGTEYRDQLAGVIDGLGEIFRAIEQAGDQGAMEPLFDALRDTLAEVERIALELAEVLPEALAQADYSGFRDGLEALFGGLDDVEVSVDGVRDVIEGLGSGFRALSEFTAGTFEVFKGLVGVVKPVVEAFLNLESDTQRLIGVVGGLSLAVAPVAGVVTTLTAAVGGLAGKSGAIATALPLIKTFAAALSGPVGITIALGLAGAALVKFGGEMLGVNDKLEESARRIEEDAKRWAAFQEAVDGVSAEEYRRFADEFGYANNDVVQQIADTREAVENFRDNLDFGEALDGIMSLQGQENPEFWERLKQYEQERIDNTKALAAETFELATAQDEANRKLAEARGQDPWTELRDAYLDYRDAFVRGEIDSQEWAAIQEEYNQRLADATGDAAKSQKELAGEILNSEEAILEARKAVLDYELELEGLASNERIKAMEFTAEINIAALQADAQKVESILNATSETITELGQTTNDMFGTLASDGLSRFQELDLERAIEQQLDIQREQADQQKRVIEAQIENMRARTDALRNGDGLINISSDGLEPALETIMWQIIEKVQMRANAEGAEFLLGI